MAAAFLVLAREVSGDPALSALDQQITKAVVAWRTPGMNVFVWGVTLLGNALFLGTAAAATVVMLLVWSARAGAVLIAGGVIVAQVISSLVKYAYQRPRPPETIMLIEAPGSHSFPSGHALLTLVFSVLLVFLLFRYVKRSPSRLGGRGRTTVILVAVVTAVVVVLAVGFSRVYLGVHWTSDILAGWCLGGAWAVAAIAGFLAWERSRRAWLNMRPLGSERARMVLVIVLVLVMVAAYVAAALADPLLV